MYNFRITFSCLSLNNIIPLTFSAFLPIFCMSQKIFCGISCTHSAPNPIFTRLIKFSLTFHSTHFHSAPFISSPQSPYPPSHSRDGFNRYKRLRCCSFKKSIIFHTNGSHSDETKVERLEVVPAFPKMKQQGANGRVSDKDQHNHYPR